MAAKAYYIPNGPKNLQAVFPDVDFNQIAEYYVEVRDDQNDVVATSPINRISDCCEGEKFRVHFVNGLGAIDAVNFKRITVEHEPKSDGYQSPVSYPLDKTAHGLQRFNVKSNDVMTGITTDYNEEHQDWLDELFDSPVAWIEWEGTQGQADAYLPILITDMKREKVKQNDRYTYEVKIEFRYSHEKIAIRN